MPVPTVPTADFSQLFMTDTPFLDVRAEAEFAKGSFSTAWNRPILNDDERHQVGKCYKEQGKEAAVELGHRLVGGDVRAQRIQAWHDFASSHEHTHVYCWRGGMRSNLARQWLAEAGMELPLIEGGFKALRRFLMETTDAATHLPYVRIGGRTGTAKTVLVNEVDRGVDLEGHANHRGSSFGRRVSGIASQIDFEHALAIDLLRKMAMRQDQPLVVEDESRRIGACAIPESLYEKFHNAPMAVVEMPFDFRVQRILQEYVIDMTQEFTDAYGDDGWPLFVDYLTSALSRVKKRLGPENHQRINDMMETALAYQLNSGDTSSHEAWITALLIDYYDPMCDYQLDRQPDKIVFRGTYDEVLAWVRAKA